MMFAGLRSRWMMPFSCAAARQPRFERLPLDELHDQGAVRGQIFEAVDVGDRRVIERGERLRLAREARDAIRIARERLGEHLDRDVTIQLEIARTVYATHAARAGVGDDLERTKTRPGFEPHECVPRL
jgi:hypothetical protein